LPERVNDTIYLLAMMGRSVSITRWAAHPYLRFMKVKVRPPRRPPEYDVRVWSCC